MGPVAHDDSVEPNATPDPLARAIFPDHVRVLRAGHGANCSSIGSVVDSLFFITLAGGALYAAVMAAMSTEPITVVGPPPVGGSAGDDPEQPVG